MDMDAALINVTDKIEQIIAAKNTWVFADIILKRLKQTQFVNYVVVQSTILYIGPRSSSYTRIA